MDVNASFATILCLCSYAKLAGWVTNTDYRLHSSYAITLHYTLASTAVNLCSNARFVSFLNNNHLRVLTAVHIAFTASPGCNASVAACTLRVKINPNINNY